VHLGCEVEDGSGEVDGDDAANWRGGLAALVRRCASNLRAVRLAHRICRVDLTGPFIEADECSDLRVREADHDAGCSDKDAEHPDDELGSR
jgi:hypothetical protein